MCEKNLSVLHQPAYLLGYAYVWWVGINFIGPPGGTW
jgi:hypothetical protein